MTQFYAQPYDLAATGFYFEDKETYQSKIKSVRNDYGEIVEEFEIQFIDGSDLDYDLSKAWGLGQSNIIRFLEVSDEWDDHQKTRFILHVGEYGNAFDPQSVDPDDFDVDIYHVESMIGLAMQFIDDGLFGEIPDNLVNYIDYGAIARDLEMDYSMATVAGERVVYRCS